MILLTGGTGFVGRHVLASLLSDNGPVRVLSRSQRPDGLSAVVQWQRGDLSDPDSLQAALRGVRTVVHAAAVLPGPGTDPSRLVLVNAQGTERLAELAREAGVERFVHIGSAGVYGDGDGAGREPHGEQGPTYPGDEYERSKLCAEQALARALDASSVSWTILRPQGLYGADRPATASFFRAVASRGWWLHGPAEVIVHPTHISDLVSVVRLVLPRSDIGKEVFNVGGERSLPFRELIDLVGIAMGRGPRQISIPHSASAMARAAAGIWPTKRPPPRLERWARRVVNRSVSTEKARFRLGFVPVPLEASLASTAAALGDAGRPASFQPDAERRH